MRSAGDRTFITAASPIRGIARTILAGFLVLIGVFGGCLADTGPEEPLLTSPAQSALDGASLTMANAKVLVSTPERRASEFWVERDPTDPNTLVIGRLDFRQLTDATVDDSWSCFMGTSNDGGHTWKDLPTQPFQGQSSDPWVAFEADGTLHAVCNTSNYARSHDDGLTWEPGKVGSTGNDRPSILVDSRGRLLYCASRPATNEGPSIVYSDDGGTTWTTSDASAVEETWEATICNHMAEGPDGTLYAGIGLSKFRVLVSRDGGATWTKGARLEMEDPRRPNYGSSVPTHKEGNMFPSFDVSPTTGTLFAAVQNYSASANNGAGAYGMELHRSRDQGANYERLTWPADASLCQNCDRTRGVLHIDDEGRLGLLWRSADLSLPVQTWFTASLDEGETWLPTVLLSTEEISEGWWNPKSFDGADHYWNMQSTPAGFVTFFIDRSDSGLSQLWSRVVRVDAQT